MLRVIWISLRGSVDEQGTEHIGLIAAVIGLISALLTLATQVGAFGDARIPGLPGVQVTDDDPFGTCNPAVIRPVLSLSAGSGPSGTELTVSGSDFCPDERVEVKLHTEQIAVADTDPDGAFSVPARIPGTFDPFAPAQFDIIARGKFGHARTPFQLTSG